MSSKKVIRLFNSATQQISFEHFKRFVKSLNGNDLGSLLHFLTGNNIIICDTITEIEMGYSLCSKRFRGVGEQRKTKERYFARVKLGREPK